MYLPRLPISSFLKNPNMDTTFYARIQAVRIKELGLFIAHTATLRWLRGISQIVTTIMDRRKRGSSRLIPTTKYMKDAAITAMTRRTLTTRPKRRGTQAVSTMMYYWDGSQGTDSMRQNEEEGWFELPTIILLSVRQIFSNIPIYVGVTSGRIKNNIQKWTTDSIYPEASLFSSLYSKTVLKHGAVTKPRCFCYQEEETITPPWRYDKRFWSYFFLY